ncbi:Alg9-like mannosyltransferase family domain-containing protein [Trichoderma aethiopicum]
MELTDILLFAVPLLHLLCAPHTKVEESFNLQATHDILAYGTPTRDVHARLASTYDHFSFPGAVPRTFVGPVLLAGVSQPLIALVGGGGFEHAQLIVRAVLGCFNAVCLTVFARAVRAAFGRAAGRWWVLLSVSQFHLMFYLSRTLPNMFAFGLTTLASAFLLPKNDPKKSQIRRRQAIGLLVFATAIFRSELAILLAATGLHLLARSQLRLRELVVVFLGAFVTALAISVPIDSYFWQRPLWPELAGFYYNAVLGSSSNWGVSPWHYYFSSALPRLLLNPVCFPLMGLALYQPATSRRVQDLVIPSLAFIAIYSIQPHKETRFIFYAVPPLTAAAAVGADYISSRTSKSIFYQLATLVIALSVLAAFASSTLMLLLSSLNYPGGDAVSQLYAITANVTSSAPSQLLVHADVLTCMTGLTLFGQNLRSSLFGRGSSLQSSSAPALVFDKTESDEELRRPEFWSQFDYLLMEDPSLALGTWDTVGRVHGYDGVEILRPGQTASSEPSQGEKEAQGKTLGHGATVAAVRDTARKYTGGWWIGPRMAPRIHIMKQVRQSHDGEESM